MLPPRGSMLRRISTKLVLAVLAAVVLPFVAFAFYLNERIADRLTRHVVQQALLGLSKDLAGQIDRFVEERSRDIEFWGGSPLALDALADDRWDREADGGSGPRWNAERLWRWRMGELGDADLAGGHTHRARLTGELDRFLRLKGVYDLFLLVGPHGRLVTCSTVHPEGGVLSEEFLEFLFAQDYGREDWFRRAMAGERPRVNHHRSPYSIHFRDTDPAHDYQVAFAGPVVSPTAPGRAAGVVFALVDWSSIQELVSSEVITDAFRGLVDEDERPSPYAWIWDADADTILGHPRRELYYQSVSRDIGLPQMTQAVLREDGDDGWGLYPEYRFQGEDKNAAFKRCRGPEEGGFGWVVGVGIDNDDIYATAEEIRALLLGGTGVVVLLVVFLTLVIAARTTGPIRELQRTTRRVAEGDLDARIEIASRDELGALAEDFNRMTAELKAQRERIVKAEKDAAWREMARQIAHDIKNPLTPIRLSLDLLERARRERPEGSEEILERTMALIRRQVENLQNIAGEFYEFTGGRRAKPERLDVSVLLDEVLHLHDAWAVELGVEVHREGVSAPVYADPGKLRRVLVNLVTNALQAMPEGGELYCEVAVEETPEGAWVVVTIRDTGAGIAEEVRPHLFEPYFTTRSEGTGLGLAISKRVIEEMGGTIELHASSEGPGTVARLRLPLVP